MKITTVIATALLFTTGFAQANETFELAVTNTKKGTSTLDEVNYRVLFNSSVGRMAMAVIPADEAVVDTLKTLTTDGIYTCSGKRFKGSIFSLNSCEKTTDLPDNDAQP